MNSAISSQQAVIDTLVKPVEAPEELVLRPLEGAEMIHVGGGYCAADY